MKKMKTLLLTALLFILVNCADDKPFLSNYIKRASTALMTNCDPYNQGQLHTCVVYASAFSDNLFVYNASAEEIVLAPMGYFPLKILAGPSTREMVAVTSKNPKFPFFLALDQGSQSVIPVRVFPSADNKKLSLSAPVPQKIPNAAYQIAAYESDMKVFVLASNLKKSSLDIFVLDNIEGVLDTNIASQTINLGNTPSHIEIDIVSKQAVISDEGQNNLHVLDLSNILADMQAKKAPKITTIDAGATTTKIYLARRNLGLGEELYLAALANYGRELLLLNISKNKLETSISLAQTALSGYFPGPNSNTCCEDKKKNWIAITSIKGQLFYYGIAESNGLFKLEESQKVDLTSKKSLALDSLNVIKMVGGEVLVDDNIKRENICPNNRKVFYVTSYGNDKFSSDPIEIEAQGIACEGENSARPLGSRAN